MDMKDIRAKIKRAKKCEGNTCDNCSLDGFPNCAPSIGEMASICEYLLKNIEDLQESKKINLDWGE